MLNTLSLLCNLFNGSKTNGCNVFFAIELAFETTLLAVLTTDSALETTLPATLPATLLAVVTTDPANPELILTARGTGYLFQRIVDIAPFDGK